MKKFLLLFILFNTAVSAQSRPDQMQKQIEEIMKAREELLRSLMDGSNMGDFDKRMEEMMKRFGGISGLDSSFDAFDSPVVGEYDWQETENEKILKIKIKQVKDRPLDIKIEQGMIKIKGDVEATQGSGNNVVKRVMKFERSFSLPADIDQTNPVFENKKDDLLVKFKKLSRDKKIKKEPSDRLPVGTDKNDLSI